jgi:hypothetical protein
MTFQFLPTNTFPVLQISTSFGFVVNVSGRIHKLWISPLALDKLTQVAGL